MYIYKVTIKLIKIPSHNWKANSVLRNNVEMGGMGEIRGMG